MTTATTRSRARTRWGAIGGHAMAGSDRARGEPINPNWWERKRRWKRTNGEREGFRSRRVHGRVTVVRSESERFQREAE